MGRKRANDEKFPLSETFLARRIKDGSKIPLLLNVYKAALDDVIVVVFDIAKYIYKSELV